MSLDARVARFLQDDPLAFPRDHPRGRRDRPEPTRGGDARGLRIVLIASRHTDFATAARAGGEADLINRLLVRDDLSPDQAAAVTALDAARAASPQP